MIKTLKLFNDEIDVDVQKFMDGKLLLEANSGGGKSHATRRIIERFVGVVPQFIIDTEGEFFSLRQKFPDFILIGKDQAIIADPKSAGMLSHKLLEERVSCIIDVLEMTPEARDEFVKNFIQAMISAPRSLWLPTLLTVDEAQVYAPEKGDSIVAKTMQDAAFRFRKRHFGMIFATPRISDFSKAVASTCRNRLVGLATQDIDMKRAAADIGFTNKEDIMSLRDLDPGEFYGHGPAFSKAVIKIKIGKTLTQHGDSTSVNARVAKPSLKVQRALEILATVPVVAAEEAKTNAQLKAELAIANRQIVGLKIGQNITKEIQVIDQNAMEKALLTRDAEWTRIIHGWKDFAFGILEATEKFKKMPMPALSPKPIDARGKPLPSFMPRAIKRTPADIDPGSVKEPLPRVDSIDSRDYSASVMNKGEKVILSAIAGSPEGVSTEDIAILTAYKNTMRNEYTKKLIARGFVENRMGLYVATAEGIEALGSDYELLPTGSALQEYWSQKLSGGEKKIFDILLSSIGYSLSKSQISALSGYKGTMTYEYVRRLAARKIVTVEKNTVYINKALFD